MLKLRSLKSSHLADMSWALVGLLGPSVLQLVYTVVAARTLNPHDFGYLAICVSVGTIMMSLAGLGSGGLLLRDVARAPEAAARYFGHTIAWTLVTAPVFIPISVAIMIWIAPSGLPAWLALAVAVSELVAWRIVINCQQVFFGFGAQFRAAVPGLLIAVARLAAACFVLFSGHTDLATFATAYLLSTVTAMVIAVLFTLSIIGRPTFHLFPFNHLGGLSFSLTWLNTAIQNESDKLILAFFSTPADVGVYNAAIRLMDGAFAPARALKQTMQAKLYRAGATGSAAVLDVMLKVIPAIVLYGLFAWAAIYFLTPLAVYAFGKEYSALARILPALGALPLIRTLADFGSDMALAADRAVFQTVVQLSASVFRAGVSLVLIGAFQINGAVASALLSTFVIGAIYWAVAIRSAAPASQARSV